MTSLHPMLSVGRSSPSTCATTSGSSGGRRARGRSSCSTRCGSLMPRPRSSDTRTSSPAACASASRSRSRWSASRAADRRRADHGARRDRAGRHPAAADRLRREHGLCRSILITHDLGVMSAIADRLAVLYAGRDRRDGPRARCCARRATRTPAALLDALPHPELGRGSELRGDPRPAAARRTCRPAAPSIRAATRGRAPCRTERPPTICRVGTRDLRVPRRSLREADERARGHRASRSSTSGAAASPVRAVAGAILAVARRPDRRPRRRDRAAASRRSRRRPSASSAPAGGSIVFDGRELAPLGRGARSRRAHVRLQMVFQNPYASLNPRRRVGAQIADGARDPRPAEPRRPATRACAELLEQVGLSATRPSPVPAPVQRRPAPADRDRARPGGRPVGARRSTSRSRRSTPRPRRRSRTCSCGSRASSTSGSC